MHSDKIHGVAEKKTCDDHFLFSSANIAANKIYMKV